MTTRTYTPEEYADIGEAADFGADYFVDSYVPPALKPTSTTPVGARTGVYFIRGAGLVKISLARSVCSRFKELQGGSPIVLTPVGFIPTPHSYRDAFAVERQLHERFAAHRQHREWFTEVPELTTFMETHLADWPE